MDLNKKEPSIRLVINYFMVVLERFSFKCRKTKTKIVITLTNHNTVNQAKVEVITQLTQSAVKSVRVSHVSF